MVIPVKGYIVSMIIKVVNTETGQVVFMGEGKGNDKRLIDAFRSFVSKSIWKFL